MLPNRFYQPLPLIAWSARSRAKVEGSQTEKRLGSRERRRLYASGVADEAKDPDEKVSKKTKAESQKEKGKESTKEKSKRSKEDRCSEEEPPKKTKRKKKDADWLA